MSNNLGNSLAAVLFGAAIGAAVGVIFAPDKGSKTRKKIKSGFNKSSEDLKENFNELTSKLKQKTNKAKAELESTFDDFLNDADAKKEDVILALEKKLAELKKSNSTK